MSGRILVTGGAGYVGSALVPRLLELGYAVRVLDLFWYGRDVLSSVETHPRLDLIEGDIRHPAVLAEAFEGGVGAVIHLACLSNDPSFELDPVFGRSVNLDAFPGLVEAARDAGAQRFVYASSSSIYGVKDQPDVHEETAAEPLTDYSRFKLRCEHLLLDICAGTTMVPVILRPATVCGYAPRLRLDLTVNILTANALERGVIRVFGGRQLRPNLHIQDMVEAYVQVLDAPANLVSGQAFNVGYQNLPVGDIANLVHKVLATGGSTDPRQVEIRVEPSDDLRSYHIDSTKIRRVLGFVPKHTLEEAIGDIAQAHAAGLLERPLDNPLYHNIRRMQQLRAR